MVIMMVFLTGCSALDFHGKRSGDSGGIENPPAVADEKASDAAERKLGSKKNKMKAVVTLHAVGRGIAPENTISRGQAILLGECAARSNGYVKLAEKVYGVYVESYRHLGQGMVDMEFVHQETQAWLKGAEVLEYRQVDHGIFEAYMEVRIIVNQDHPLYPQGT